MTDHAQIRAARTLLGWTQKDLSTRAGVSRRTITTIENGLVVVADKSVEAVVTALQAGGVTFVSEESVYGVLAPRPDPASPVTSRTRVRP
jgi:transcriptional regulator with XRE-family HTH domain